MKQQLSRFMLPAAAMLCIAYAADVNVDYDKKADFTRYRTYSWLGVSAGNSLWEDRIRGAVDGQLAAKGWTRVASGGDAALSAFGKVTEQQNIQTYYNGFPGWYWGGIGSTTTTVVPERIGNVVVDVFDGHTKRLVWRGTASDALSSKPEKNERKLEKAVDDMFDKFPPKERG